MITATNFDPIAYDRSGDKMHTWDEFREQFAIEAKAASGTQDGSTDYQKLAAFIKSKGYYGIEFTAATSGCRILKKGELPQASLSFPPRSKEDKEEMEREIREEKELKAVNFTADDLICTEKNETLLQKKPKFDFLAYIARSIYLDGISDLTKEAKASIPPMTKQQRDKIIKENDLPKDRLEEHEEFIQAKYEKSYLLLHGLTREQFEIFNRSK